MERFFYTLGVSCFGFMIFTGIIVNLIALIFAAQEFKKWKKERKNDRLLSESKKK